MSLKESGSVYIFQGNSLIVPVETPDSLLCREVNRELLDAAFKGAIHGNNGMHDLDSFVVSALDGQGEIHCISIPEGELPPGWKAVSIRHILNISGGIMTGNGGPISRILRSCHISLWRKESRFCGSCGKANQDTDSGETARQCTVCGRLEFPRITPAVITLVTNDRGEVLLAHNMNFPSGLYSLIAGFNEAGESLEATVAREIKEEVNIDVRDIRYVRSQPWPFPNSLMTGFAARYDGGELKPDGIEIEDARWFSRDDLPLLPGHGSVSRYLIDLWREGEL